MRRADHSSRGVLPTVVCLSVECGDKTSIMMRTWPAGGLLHNGKNCG